MMYHMNLERIASRVASKVIAVPFIADDYKSAEKAWAEGLDTLVMAAVGRDINAKEATLLLREALYRDTPSVYPINNPNVMSHALNALGRQIGNYHHMVDLNMAKHIIDHKEEVLFEELDRTKHAVPFRMTDDGRYETTVFKKT